MKDKVFTRIGVDRLAGGAMRWFTLGVILLVISVFIGLWYKSAPILAEKSILSLLTSTEWRPSQGQFGFLPFIAGTLVVTAIAILIALPISLLTAIFLTEYANEKLKRYILPALDILAGLPSVIYGVWGTLLVVPFISETLAPHFVEYSTGYCTLAAGIVLAVMVLPLLISLFVEVLSVVPVDLRHATLSLGATKWETIKLVVLRKSFSGILAAVVLAVSRAFGETIAVLMVCGNLPVVPHSLFDSCYTIPSLIANNYGEMLSVPLYDSALMLAAFFLFIVVFIFNAVSRVVLYQLEK
jgi:phosphate transport system permease protein